jgi:hypothetical protein
MNDYHAPRLKSVSAISGPLSRSPFRSLFCKEYSAPAYLSQVARIGSFSSQVAPLLLFSAVRYSQWRRRS